MSLPSKGRPSPQSSPPPSSSVANKKATDGPATVKPGAPKATGASAPNIWEQKKQAQAAAAAANLPFQNVSSAMTQMFCVLSKGALYQVRLKSQERWEGSFVKLVGTDGGFSLELAYAQKLGGRSGPYPTRNTNPFERTKIFKDSEIDSITGSQTHAPPVSPDAEAAADPHGFATDSQISHRQFKERDLQRWEPENGDHHGSLDEDSSNRSNANWDQFRTNEQRFGVTSSFDFEMYTTELDRNSEFYRKNEREAERIARLIAKESTENVHMAIDRGQDVGEDYDEDRLYSSVDRSADAQANATPSKSGVYRPPHLRDKNDKPASKPSAPEPAVPKPTASPPPSTSPAPTTPSAPTTTAASVATPPVSQSSASVSSSPMSSSSTSSATATPSTSSSAAASASTASPAAAAAAESKTAEDNKPKKKLNASAKSFIPRFGPAASDSAADTPAPAKQPTPQMGPQAAPAWAAAPAMGQNIPPMPMQPMMPMQSMMPMPPPYYVVGPAGMVMPMPGQPFMGGAVMAPPMYPAPVRGQPPVGSPLNPPAMAGIPPPNFNLQQYRPQPGPIPPQPYAMQPPQPGMAPKFPARPWGGPA